MTQKLPSALSAEWATIATLCKREMLRFFKERTRLAGAVIQPLIFWWVIGQGMGNSFKLEGSQGVGYSEFFFPGILLMVVLFSSIFTTMSLVEDRNQGFLQGVLVAPGSRIAAVLGKCAGASTVALIQSAFFICLAPLAGFAFSSMFAPWILCGLACIALGLSAAGFAIAWWLNSIQGYHIVMSLLLIPAWILSGAVFPVPQSGWLRTLVLLNPLSHALNLVRQGLYGRRIGTLGHVISAAVSLPALALFTALMIIIASVLCYKRR